jgi:electron transport complex protein RnfG
MISFLKQTWLVLLLAVGFGITLAAVEGGLADRIAMQQRLKLERSIQRVVPGAVESKKVDGLDFDLYRVTGDDGELVGWAYPAAAQGYADKVRVLIGLDAAGETITGIDILYTIETPGLGDRIKADEFRDRFKGKSTGEPIPILKGKAESDQGVHVLTGATYSSEAVINAANVKREQVRAAIEKLTATTQPEE